MPVTTATPTGGVLVSGSADVGFVSGAPGQVDPAVIVQWDFDNDGDFGELVEDVTAFVLAAECTSGRDWPSLLQGKAAPGTLRLTLDNTDDRFSYFNAASPLNTAPFSLRTGRKMRVRTADGANPDPTVRARDRFREEGAMTVDELGNTWTTHDAGLVKLDGRATFPPTPPGAGTSERTVDVTANDYYAQITSEFLDDGSGNSVAIIYRRQDADNYGWAWLSSQTLLVQNVVAGVATTVASYDLETGTHHHLTYGIHAHGTTVDLYVEGVLVDSGTAATFTGGVVGIWATWVSPFSRAPAVEEFWVFTDTTNTEPEVIWTGDVASVVPAAPVAGLRTVSVTAEGRLARAANVDVEISGSVEEGRRTGVAVGHVLSRAGLNTPPAFLDEGDVTTGPFGFDRTNALELARRFEETELGFLHESPEGPLAFQSRTARDATPTSVGFSDQPGAQFGYSSLALLDHQREIVNQVTAGVAALDPGAVVATTDSNSTGAGVTNHVNVDLLSANPTDLMLVFVASTVRTAGVRWITPNGWTALQDPGDQSQGFTMGIYARCASTGNMPASVRLYTDSGAAGGAWVAKIVRVQDWFRSMQGVAIVPPTTANTSLGDTTADGADPPEIRPPWGFYPTLFIAAYAGMESVGGIGTSSPSAPPRYTNASRTTVNGTVNAFDVGLGIAWRRDNVDLEDPGPFGAFDDVTFAEATIVAVRGPNTLSPTTDTFDDPSLPTGFCEVTVDDLASQDDHRSVRTHRNAANLFAEADDAIAYADAVLTRYADDRPIFALSFPATINADYRTQAIERKVGHKVTLTANGDTGMGVQGDFFIEKVTHSWPDAKRWQVTWELSPA